MIYLTQLIYIKPGQEKVFHDFEELVLPLIPKYNGELLLRVRPDQNAFIINAIEQPYELHLVCFGSEKDFQDFMKDETRKAFLHLKEQAIKTSILIKGVRM